MIQQTSLLAYNEVLGDLGRRQKQVLEAFQIKDFTNQELSEYLKWPINTITPRVGELRIKGLVVEKERRKDKSTGRTAIVWGLKPHENKLF